MNNKILKSIIGGIAGTAAMSIVMWIAGLIGMPKMSPPEMLSMMMGIPIAVGWIMHFMIGITFALMYVFILLKILKKINSDVLKGIIFGLFAFVFGQVMIAIMTSIFGEVPPPEGSMMAIMAGSILGHLIFGITVALVVKKPN